MPGQQTTTSRVRGGTIRTAFFALFGVAVLALLWWQSQLPDAPPAPHGQASQQAIHEPNHATGSDDVADSEARDLNLRRPATVPAEKGAHEQWTVQLTGIKPGIPWTAPLLIVFQAQLEVRGTVDDQGACRFVPPPGAREVDLQLMQVIARDENYRITIRQHRSATLQRTGHMKVGVHAIGILGGRVLDPQGMGIIARVRAFAFYRHAPSEPLARTISESNGRYELQVPPGVPLLVVADAIAEPHSTLGEITQGTIVGARTEQPSRSQMEDLAFHHVGQTRSGLLPAALTTKAVFRSPIELHYLQLGTASLVTGRVRFRNGQPLAGAIVRAHSAKEGDRDWRGLRFWSDRNKVVFATSTRTNHAGEFSLHLDPSTPFRVSADSEQPLLLAGTPSTVTTAPSRVDLRVPGELLTIRATKGNKPLPGAAIDFFIETFHADAQGVLQVTLKPEGTFLRARDELSAPAWTALPAASWTELPATGRPETMQLSVESPELSKVRIDLRSTPVLRDAVFVWQPMPSGRPITLPARRLDGQAPFELQVPAGNYELSIQDVKHAQGGAYLLPCKYRAEVSSAGLARTFDVTFGGAIEIDLHAASRMRIVGRFTLMTASGEDVTPQTIALDKVGIKHVGQTGKLQSIGCNRLATLFPAGTYTLTVHTITGVSVARTVTVTARSSTHVPIVLR